MATNIKNLAAAKQPIFKAGQITRIILPNGQKYEASSNGIFENPTEWAKKELTRLSELNSLSISVEDSRSTKVESSDEL